MSPHEHERERIGGRHDAGAPPEAAAYASPRLRRYGSFLELTRADQHNAGTPDGAFEAKGGKIFMMKSL